MSRETQRFEFGGFLLDVHERVLLRDGEPFHVPPKILRLLTVLVENHGHIVEKQTLMSSVWEESFVEDGSLTFAIGQLRKLLDDDKRHPTFIETIPKRGYRFVGPVIERVADLPAIIPSHEQSHSRQFRPILLSTLAVFLIAALASGGFFVWNERDLGKRGSDAREDLSFDLETVFSQRNPITAAISPDGKYLAYTATTGGQKSLWLRQIATGVNTQIREAAEGVDFYGLEFSSDSEYVYFTSRYRSDRARLDRISIFDGTVNEGIVDNVDGDFSISTDGRGLSFRRFAPDRRSLLAADADGSNEREIFSTTKTITGNAFSPDGKTIAFASGQADTGDRDFGVYTIGAHGSEAKTATDFRWLYVHDVVWLPDQSGLLVTARVRNEPQRVWRINLSNGAVEPVPGMPVGSLAISASKDLSRILLTQASRSATVYLASTSDPDDLQPLTQGWENAVWAPANELVYDSLAGGNDDIWLLRADRKSQMQLTTESSTDFDPRISPDGRYIAFVSDRAGKYNVWRIDADGNHPVRLTNGSGEQSPAFTPNGEFVVFSSMSEPGFWRVPVSGGEPAKILDVAGGRISISHDGDRFACFTEKDARTVITVRSFLDGQMLAEFEIPDGYFAGPGIRWTRDGRSLVYVAHDSGPVDNLWQQDIAGGPPRKLTNYNEEEIYSFDFSPNDSQIALTRGYWSHDTVMVKGFRAD